LAAPNGRAAKRLSESTGLEAKTIHRLLGVDPKHGGFRRNEEHALYCDLLVVGETSMIDVPLMHALLKAVPDHAADPGRRRRSTAVRRPRAGACRSRIAVVRG
jgi:exodeoxyribonuclease V alpha subunit